MKKLVTEVDAHNFGVLEKMQENFNIKVNSVAWALGGKYLISGGKDNHIKIFDTKKWKLRNSYFFKTEVWKIHKK